LVAALSPVASLCLVIDFVLFVAASGLETDAVRTLGELDRLRAALERAPSAPTLTVVLAQLGPGDFGAQSRLLGEATHGSWSVVERDWRKQCHGSDTVILLTRDERQDVPGVLRWILGDAVRGPGGFEDVARRVREFLQIPVPRPVSPANRSGALVALNGLDQGRALLKAAFRDGALDWVEMEQTTLVYLEDTDAEDQLVQEAGASRLSFSVRKASLYVAPAPSAGEALWRGRQFVLLSVEHEAVTQPADWRPWESVRHSRLGSPR
jgi:hypothetical protein